MKCPKCGGEVRQDVQFCDHCGYELHPQVPCPYCGKMVRKGAAFCNGCGKSLTEDAKAVPQKKAAKQDKTEKLIIAAIICVVIVLVVFVIAWIVSHGDGPSHPGSTSDSSSTGYSGTATPTPAETTTQTATLTPSPSANTSAEPSATPTPTVTPTPTPSPSPSTTPSAEPSATPKPSQSAKPSTQPSSTPTATPETSKPSETVSDSEFNPDDYTEWTVSPGRLTTTLGLRSEPTQDSEQIAQLEGGDTVYEIERTNDTFWYVYVPELDLYGYVKKEYLGHIANLLQSGGDYALTENDFICKTEDGTQNLRTEYVDDDTQNSTIIYFFGDDEETFEMSNGIKLGDSVNVVYSTYGNKSPRTLSAYDTIYVQDEDYDMLDYCQSFVIYYLDDENAIVFGIDDKNCISWVEYIVN